jgi:hypothetical protein
MRVQRELKTGPPFSASCGFEVDRPRAWPVRFAFCCSQIEVPQRTGKGPSGRTLRPHRGDAPT